MSDRKDGVPFPVSQEEMHEIMAGKDPMEGPPEPKEVVEKVPLTDSEAGVLLGLSVAAGQIQNETQGFIANAVCARLGIHQSLTVQFNAKEKWISVRSEAPKEK